MNPAEEGQRGLKLTAEELAEGIVRRERGEKLAYGVIDPSAFTEDGGPSKSERINNVLGAAHMVGFHAADNRRVPGVGKHDAPRGPVGGWDQLRARMKGTEGKPMIYTWDTCAAAIRTIPAMQHDPNRPEDIDTSQEDHCLVGSTIVATPNGMIPLDQLPTSGMIWAGDGSAAFYRSARMTRRNVRVIELLFDDGSQVVCTPDHRFMVKGGHWVEARSMLGQESYAYALPPWMSRQSSANPARNFAGSTITSAAHTFRHAVNAFIVRSGKPSTAQSRARLISTTRMAISTIINPATWSASIRRHILPIMGDYALAIVPRCSLSTPDQAQPHGTSQPQAGSGIRNTSKTSGSLFSGESTKPASIAERHSAPTTVAGSARMPASLPFAALQGWMTKGGSAPNAALDSVQTGIPGHSPALPDVQALPRRERGPVCLSLKDAGRADVYCLTVPATGSFLLANGSVVANCADSWRYACMSRPWLNSRKPILTPLDGYKAANEDALRDRWMAI